MQCCLISNLNVNGLHSGQREPVLDELTPPLGLLTLAAVSAEVGYYSHVVDLNYMVNDGALKLDDSFYEEAVNHLASLPTRVFGFSTMCASMHITLRLAEKLRAQVPDCVILLGGPQVTFVPDETLQNFDFIDFVLVGEAEISFPLFLDYIHGQTRREDVLGLVTRNEDGSIFKSRPAPIVDDLDTLPYPQWDRFKYDLSKTTSIDVGRGCPFTCGFCSTSVFFKRRFRLKSYNRIIAEMRYMRDNHGATSVNLVHDLFTANKKWVRGFCEAILSEDDFSISWAVSARIDTVDRELLRLMGRAGCVGLFYGVESGSPRVQRDMGKKLKVENVVPLADVATSANMNCTMSFIAGFPIEREEDLVLTFDLVEELLRRPNISTQLHLMSPQSGTSDYIDFNDKLRIDSYFSDIAQSPAIFIEKDWIREHPKIFPSFYYFELESVSRSLLVGMDQFVRLPCAALRRTVQKILHDTKSSLWLLYKSWNKFCIDSGYHNDITNSIQPDELLVKFIEFAEDYCDGTGIVFPADLARDELLAFYFIRYHELPSVWHANIHSSANERLVLKSDLAQVEEEVA